MTSCDAGRVAQPLGDGLFLIDTEYVRPGLAASHLVVDQGRAAFIDTGPGPAAPRLLAALDELGLAREQVDYLFLTHVHLDHAGGAGQMMQALPNAKAVLHPRGAPHLVDPSKLIAGTIAVYGDAAYHQLYGELLPIPADRVLLMADGMRLQLGARTFEFIDAPGHARHHHCPIDLDFRDVYAGDNFGIQRFAFNIVGGTATERRDITALPTDWRARNDGRMAGFGRFDITLNGRGKPDSRQDPLTFSISGVSLDTILSYVDLSTGRSPEGYSFFSAHVAGLNFGNCEPVNTKSARSVSTSTVSNCVGSAFFGGTQAVPAPPAIWLLGTAVAGLAARRLRRL